MWWLLAAVGLVVIAAALLVPRTVRRRHWDADLAGAEGEVAWLARELLPQLQQARTPDEVAGGWRVMAARVTSAEDRLTILESSAPDETRRSRAHTLRDAVRAARTATEGVIVSGDTMTAARELGAAAARLEAVLDAAPNEGPPAR